MKIINKILNSENIIKIYNVIILYFVTNLIETIFQKTQATEIYWSQESITYH